jgi:hypothetical protein
MAVVGVVLRGHGGCRRYILCHGRCCCMAMVGIMTHGCGGHCIALPWWVSSRCILCHGHCHCVAVVGIVSRGCDGCHCTMLSHGQGCCMVAVGVVAPCCVMVAMGVTQHGVAVAVAALVVSWLQSLHCV